MSTTMRAVRDHSQKDVRVDTIPRPTVGDGEVLIDIAFCGICGSDLHEYLDGPLIIPPPGHPHPISGDEMPITLGHEMSGTVAALGAGVTDLEVGQHVVVEAYIIGDDIDETTDPHYNLTPRRASRQRHRGPDGASHGVGPDRSAHCCGVPGLRVDGYRH